MNDILLDPPSPPTPDNPKPGAGMKQMGIIMGLIAIVALLIGILLASSQNDSSSSDVKPDPAPVITASPAPAVNKYDAYLEHVYNNSGKANTWSKADVIEYGDLVCQSLDNGSSISRVVSVISSASSSTSDAELGASVVFGAITYLCDEYKLDLNSYLAN
jgi:hypothetical protein